MSEKKGQELSDRDQVFSMESERTVGTTDMMEPTIPDLLLSSNGATTTMKDTNQSPLSKKELINTTASPLYKVGRPTGETAETSIDDGTSQLMREAPARTMRTSTMMTETTVTELPSDPLSDDMSADCRTKTVRKIVTQASLIQHLWTDVTANPQFKNGRTFSKHKED